MKFGRNKLETTLSYGENPESLCHVGLIQYWVVTDRQTDIIRIAYSARLALRVFTRKTKT